MDEDLFLCRCMHLGPVFEMDLRKTVPEVSDEIVKKILNTAISKFGSCAVLAIDSDLYNAIIGVLFFYPQIFLDKLNGAHPCIQDPKELNKIKPILDKMLSVPNFEELQDKDKILRIECMQVVGKPGKRIINSYEDLSNKRETIKYASYTNKGIGDGMITKLITWARDYGWKKIQSTAIPDVKPLKLWWGNQSLSGYLKKGFTIIEGSKEIHKEVLDGINNMKKGLHGVEIQSMWKDYENKSEGELITTYQVELVL